jgi:internalin A
MSFDWGNSEAYVGQLLAALTVLEVDAAVVFEWDVLALCTNLVSLKLRLVNTSDLDLRNCSSLQKVELTSIKGLEIVRLGPSLRSLHISWCMQLVRVCGPDRLIGLLSLVLMHDWRLSKLPNLIGLKCLHTLKCDGSEIEEVQGLDGLVGLISLSLRECERLSKLPSLTGLQYLKVIDSSGTITLTSLQGFGDLRALTTINLSRCEWLRRLPNMSNLTNLKVLDLRDTRVEL